ncbi:hypothetical protein INT48_002277 [Thamnidium elegans]|uniref:Pre-mRNA-splicing factor 38 n=1 Tax=Thamnidium elegans TaxID=101142 RepID=A0A8H7VXI4_9FUNG|nr:hypothetical protein INT48_002277 [Thamnidium elegans]
MSNKKANNILETWGNESTMNLNAIIYQNILSSPYFRSLFNKKTFHEIVDEIYNEVYVLSPFVKGTQPSTAYCCLFKMWTLRLTIKQIENMIDHVDSPYIRAIGFLYLRYVCAPAKLWDWFQYYLEDEEEITISSGPKPTKVTIGKFCRMLITELKFQGTMLPRIPVPIARDLEKKLDDYDREKRRKSGGGRKDRDEDEYRSYGGLKDRDEDDYRSHSRSKSRSSYRSRSPIRRRSRSPIRRGRSRSPDRRRRSKSPRRRSGGIRDELDEYERKSSRHRRRSISSDYRRNDRYRSRSRSRESRRD